MRVTMQTRARCLMMLIAPLLIAGNRYAPMGRALNGVRPLRFSAIAVVLEVACLLMCAVVHALMHAVALSCPCHRHDASCSLCPLLMRIPWMVAGESG